MKKSERKTERDRNRDTEGEKYTQKISKEGLSQVLLV